MFDTLLHQPVRTKIVSLLIKNGELPFVYLKKELNLTDGNLSSHLKKLDEAGYIEMIKFFENKRPKTVIKITKEGKKAFKRYLKELEEFIKDNHNKD